MTIEPVKRPRGRPRKNPLIVSSPPGDLSVESDTIHIVRGVTQEDIEDSIRNRVVSPLKVHIYPLFKPEESGGIPRVVDGQKRHLVEYGIVLTDDPEEADVIAAHATVDNAYINRFPRKAFVAICHGLYWSEYDWGGKWPTKVNKDVLENIKVSDAVAACSDWVANAIRRHTSRRVYVINHGVDLDEWDSTMEKKEYVLWNKTRPDPVCDPEPMNQVAALLPKTRFISTFGQQTPNVVLTDKLEFQDAKKLIMQAGVYLCTSRETFGIGTLEALACGVPVVGFAWGGQAEFIENGKDGWLVTPGDVKGLAEKIEWAMANRVRLAPACIAKAEQFTWDKPSAEYAKLFREAYERKNRVAPRTSIIVTNHNLGRYLNDCLQSVFDQTDDDWECIVVDDESSPDDPGLEITKQWMHDDRFKLIENPKNAYLAEARNIGIRRATGRYILPLDADDMLGPSAVGELANALDYDRHIHVAYGKVKFVEEDGTTPREFGYGFPPGYSSWPWQFEHEQQIMQRNLLPYASMFRREAWEQTGGYRRRCRTAEDADFWTRLSSYGFKPQMVTEVDTLVHRYRIGSMSQKQGEVPWTSWFPWAKKPELTPAGAYTKEQLGVSSLDPIIVSVIIPVGPGHDSIFTDAVDSVDAQTFRNWECIVVNDTGVPLISELPAWVRVLETSGATGPAHARNVGIKAAKGRLFLPLDADDYLEPNALEYMVKANHDTHDVIYTDFWQTDQDTGKIVTIHQCDDYDPHLLTGKTRMVRGSQRQGMIHSVTALTPKTVWELVGGYDENLPAWEDWDFQLSIAAKGVCSRRIALPLFMYRKHTGFRRLENYDAFESSKQAIISKWGSLWEGGQELMACGSCGIRANYQPGASWSESSQQSRMAPAENGEAQLISYEGDKTGSIPFRGSSNTMYWFSQGDKKYVLAQDVESIMRFEGFSIVSQIQAPSEPELVADGRPIS